jgi:hypothetical protein
MWLREAQRDVLSCYTADDLTPAEIYDAVRALPPEEPQNVGDACRIIQDSGAVGAAAGVRGEHHVRQMPADRLSEPAPKHLRPQRDRARH